MSPGHSTAPSVVPQLAVSVLMLRGKVPDLEIFVQNRTLTMDFAAGMVVFPGGRVDEVDRVASRSRPVPPDLVERHARCWAGTSIGGAGRTNLLAASAVLLAAAVREVEEETGVLIPVRELNPWANWITPTGYGRRFDTFFFLALPAASLDPQHKTTEADSSHWAPVRDVLRGATDGRLTLMRPTASLLQELARSRGDLTGQRRIVPVGRL